ncbi:MAG: glycosyltransferase family 2 protein [Treponema sp.]
MNNKIVSIIMPCHNGAAYIAKAIDSVIAQTYNDWELLIIDDKSTDDSVLIAENYANKDPRIRCYKNMNSTRMPASPRNVGIKEARGRYIAFLDCDDLWIPSKLGNQLPLFEHETCAVVYSYYQKIDEYGNIISKPIEAPKSVSYKELLNGDCIGNLTGIYDTKKVGKVFQKEIHAEDYLMWLEILSKGYIAMNTNSVEGYYRVTFSSTSSNKIKSALWNWNIYRKELKLSFIEALHHFTMYSMKGVFKFLM